ncbi:Two-pore potassium channel 5 [Platanthera guangdongensis]|uniref:Two-pore potassium channel 5 n=1 Tax=Platanthera guangdongensis TaxID=2320717 RepID=A0ABR2MZ36_9ASPA
MVVGDFALRSSSITNRSFYDHFTNPEGYKRREETNYFVDMLYFYIVSFCTVGYGDIFPQTPETKIMSCFFALVGVGIINVLLSIFISYILDTHNKWFLGKVRVCCAASFAFDAESGQIKIYAHVVCNIMILIVIIAVSVIGIQNFEKLNFVDSLYLLVDASLVEEHDVDANGVVVHIHGNLIVTLGNFRRVGATTIVGASLTAPRKRCSVTYRHAVALPLVISTGFPE